MGGLFRPVLWSLLTGFVVSFDRFSGLFDRFCGLFDRFLHLKASCGALLCWRLERSTCRILRAPGRKITDDLRFLDELLCREVASTWSLVR